MLLVRGRRRYASRIFCFAAANSSSDSAPESWSDAMRSSSLAASSAVGAGGGGAAGGGACSAYDWSCSSSCSPWFRPRVGQSSGHHHRAAASPPAYHPHGCLPSPATSPSAVALRGAPGLIGRRYGGAWEPTSSRWDEVPRHQAPGTSTTAHVSPSGSPPTRRRYSTWSAEPTSTHTGSESTQTDVAQLDAGDVHGSRVCEIPAARSARKVIATAFTRPGGSTARSAKARAPTAR